MVMMFAVCLVLAAEETAGANDIEQLLQNRFEPVLRKTMQEHHIPGAAVAVVKGGKLAYARGFGVRNVDSGEAVSTRSLFHMASVTKTFVATAVMQLWEQGKISLDAPVVSYLPYFRLDDTRYKGITIARMLNHTSGMPDVMDYEWDRPAYDDGALEEYVRSLSSRKLIAAPGDQQRYSNMAYEVLGDVVSKASGMTFEDYVEQHILKPLHMNDSTLMKPKADAALLTAPHITKDGSVQVSKVFPYNRKHAPSSTLLSSALDMSRWALVNLNKGELDGVRILKESTYDVMWGPRDKAFPHIGMSWFLGERNGRKTVAHGGGDVGFASYLLLFPDQSLGVVTMANLGNAPASTLAFAAAEAILDPQAQRLD